MFQKNTICLLMYFSSHFWGTSAMQIQLEHRGTGVFGGNETELICSFIEESKEEIISLQIVVANGTTSTFEPIVLFRPNGDANLTKVDGYLRGRVELNNSINESRHITLKFTYLICADENDYKCRIWYFDNFNQIMKETETSKIIVQVRPSKPERVSRSNSTQLFEGRNATFDCHGNVGKPPGKFLWQKILKNNSTPINYDNVTTITTDVTESCSYKGTSVLTITVTAEDNEAIMRCAVQSMSALYQDTQPVSVFYKVRKPSITKHPNQEFYLVGSGDIQLTCNADGNPQSNYIWYKEDNMTHSLSLNASLIIDSMNITNSGTFVCYAFSNLSVNPYDTNETADISIVYDIPDASTSTQEIAIKDKKVYEKINFVVVSVLAVILSLIVVITVSCIVRKYIFIRHKSNAEDSNNVIERGNRNLRSEKNLPDHYSLATLPNDDTKADLSDSTNDASNCKTHVFYKGATNNTKAVAKRLVVEKIPEYATVTKISKLGIKQSNILYQETNSLQIKDDIYAESAGLYDTLGNSRHKPIANCEMYDHTPKRRSPESGNSLHIRRIPEYATVTKIPKLGNKHPDEENTGLYDTLGNSRQKTNFPREMYDHIPIRRSQKSGYADEETQLADAKNHGNTSVINDEENISNTCIDPDDTSKP